MEYYITVNSDYSIKIERVPETGIPANGTSVRRYIFISDENYERLVPINDLSTPAAKSDLKTPQEAAPPAAASEPEMGLFNGGIYGCSNKFRQILMVLSAIRQNRDEISDIKINIVRSIKGVAKKLEIEHSTIYDKITRQCHISMNNFNEMVAKWLETGKFNELDTFLMNNLTSQPKLVYEGDLRALKEFEKTIGYKRDCP